MTEFFKNKLPFKVVSSSVNSGYVTQISAGYKPGIEIINLHRDTYGELEGTPTQGPFTSEHVGGYQFRHVPFNTGSDNDFNRPEYFKINPTASSLRVYGPDYESVHKPRGQMWKGAKSPSNIENIRSTERIVGNFEKNYQVVQTSGRNISNSLIVDGYTASAELTTQFITGVNNYSLPNLLTNSKSIIVERFNAPGGKEESSRGALDRNGEELSPNNSLTTRNIKVRQPFYRQLTQHMPQFGSGSTYNLLPATGTVDAVSIHKVNRNGLKTIIDVTTVTPFTSSYTSSVNTILSSSIYSYLDFAEFGTSLSLNSNGNIIAIGAINDDPYDITPEDFESGPFYNIGPGAVYIFRSGNLGWYQESILIGSLADPYSYYEQFGISVDLNSQGNILIVGANYDGPLSDQPGIAYIFISGTAGWAEQQVLSGSLSSNNQQFGTSVAINSVGNRVIIGANLEEDPASIDLDTGLAYIFTSSSLGWVEEKIFSGSLATSSFDNFGCSVAIDSLGQRVVIGASGDERTGQTSTQNEGLAYIFTSSSLGWFEEKILSGSLSTGSINEFGISVSISADGGRIVVGDTNNIVYIFQSGNLGWYEESILTGSIATDSGDLFGNSVSINTIGNTIIVGAKNDISGTNAAGSGVVYIFVSSSIGWNETQRITGALSINPSDEFGFAVDLNEYGNIFAIGSPYSEGVSRPNDDGLVYIKEDSAFVISGTIVSSSYQVFNNLYDNFWVQHNLPRNNYGYLWITASSEDNVYRSQNSNIFTFSSSINNIPINFETQTLLGSLSGSEQVYSSWKQTRTNEHPVSRKFRELNLISVLEEPKTITQRNGKQVRSIKTNSSNNFKEPLVTNKFYPLEQEVTFDEDQIGEEPTKLIYTDRNSTSYFANDSLNNRLNLSTNDNLPTSEFYNVVLNSVKYAVDSPIEQIISIKFKENVYPKALNAYLSGTRNRTEYFIEKPGFDRDGYDRQLGTQRAFWKDEQLERRRSSNDNGGHINSLGYSSVNESGSNFIQAEEGILFDNSYVTLSSSYSQNIDNFNIGINNSIIYLENSSSKKEIFRHSASYENTFFTSSNLALKNLANISKIGYVSDISGELNNSFTHFYEQFILNNKKQSIGSIYKNTNFKKMLTSLYAERENINDSIIKTEDEVFIVNPKPKYVSFIGGGELNTGSLFDNLDNFSNENYNVFINGANGDVNSILTVGNKVYFGGNFTQIGGISAKGIAVYDKTTLSFSELGKGLTFEGAFFASVVNEIILSGSDLYIGGSFNRAYNSLNNVITASHIAKWNTQTGQWSSVNNSLNGSVSTMSLLGSDLYLGGFFTSSSAGAGTNKVAKLSLITNEFSKLGGGITGPGSPKDSVVFNDNVYFCGQFTTVDSPAITCNHIARWSAATNSWSALPVGGGTKGVSQTSSPGFTVINSMVERSGKIYFGGFFTRVGNIFMFNGNIGTFNTFTDSFDRLQNSDGVNAPVESLALADDYIYVAGQFTSASTGGPLFIISAPRITKYSLNVNNSASFVGSGFTSIVDNIFSKSGNDIYIGGPLRQYNYNTNNIELINTNQNYNIFNSNILNTTSSLSSSDILFSTLDSGLIKKTEDFKIKPFFNKIDEFYKNDIYQIAKDYSILSEFKISDQIKHYVTTGSSNFKIKNNSLFLLDGAEKLYNSSNSTSSSFNKDFFEKYVYTDKLVKEKLEIDYKDNLTTDSITINVKGVKKLLPYNGFYPQDRSIQIANLYNEYINNSLDGGIYSLLNINDSNYRNVLSSSIESYKDISNINVELFKNKYILMTQDYNFNNVLSVFDLKATNSDIYVAFDEIDNVFLNYFGKYSITDKKWYSLGQGLNSFVYAINISGTDIYVGGDFTSSSAGNLTNKIAKYNTTTNTWSKLSGGLNNDVVAVAVSGNDIYVGGYFTSASNSSDILSKYISKWNTQTGLWSSLDNSLDGAVEDIVVSGSDIYMCGYFISSSASSTTRRIARYSTTSNTLSSLNANFNAYATCMLVSGTDIYVGGDFTSSSAGNGTNYIAKYNTITNTWSKLNGGLNENVYSLSLSGSDIYAAGTFTSATNGSAIYAAGLAKWSTITNTWSATALTSSVNGNPDVYATSMNNNILYIAGAFDTKKTPKSFYDFQNFAVYDLNNSTLQNLDYTKTYIYSSSQNDSFKEFVEQPVYTINGHKNSRLISASNGLNLFSFSYEQNPTNYSLFNSLSDLSEPINFSNPSLVVNSIHNSDGFGEYFDYYYENIPSSEKIHFVISSPLVTTGSKVFAGAVSYVSATMNFDFAGNKYWDYSNKIILGTGSNSDNRFGSGVSIISCSFGYQVFMGELLGDTNSANFGNIWVTTSSNGIEWSSPISIVSGTNTNSFIGFNNIKAVNFKDKSFVFFSEPYHSSSGDIIQGKLFVISSSINNNWGTTNIDSKKTTLYTSRISLIQGETTLDITGSNIKSIEVFSDAESIKYSFVDSVNTGEVVTDSSIYIGTSYDGINWQKDDNLFSYSEFRRGADIVGKSKYKVNSLEFPVFFTNFNTPSFTAGLDVTASIKAFSNNLYTKFSIHKDNVEKYVKQAALEPIMAPGILYNTIKSGIAVDWPCATGSQIAIQPYGSGTIVNTYYPQSFKMFSHEGENINELNIYGNLRSNIDYRVNFEKLIFPDDIFITKKALTSSIEEDTILTVLDNNSEIVKNINGTYIYGGYEPYISPIDFGDIKQLGPKRFSIPFVYRKEEAKDTGLYSMAMSNFLAETVKFFLKDGLLTSFQSNPDSQWGIFENSKTYYMDVIISKTPELIMMEAYHSDKHPIGPNGEKMNGRYFGYPVNKTNKKLWSQDSDTLFTDEEARLMHNDPAYAPYTPPYLEGQAIARLSFSPSSSKNYTIDEIFSQIVVENIFPAVERGAHTGSDAFINKMPVASSINYKGKLPWVDVTRGTQNNETTNNSINSWIIGTRFETPVLDFSSQSLTPYEDNVIKSSGFGRGMWSGYGQIPTDQKGIYVSLKESYPQEYSLNSQKQSLLQKVGFTQNDKKIGLLADKKTIKEAVMIIPFIEKLSTTSFRTYSYNNVARGDTRRRGSFLTSIEKELGIEFIGVRRDIYKQVVDGNIQSSILDTYNRMKEFVVPPLLDYVKDSKIDPYVAYVVDFSHDLSQQDLADIWQGVAPQISRVAELDQQSITHENKLTEFFHGEGMPNDVRFMVFKIKQKGEFNYFKITKDSTDDLNFKFEQKIGRSIDDYSYNWPYDFYSLVELAKVDVEIGYKKKEDVAQDTTEPVTVPIVTPTRGGNI